MVNVQTNEKGKVIYIRVVVYSEPVAQGRPRFSTQGKFVRAYDPKKSRDYKNLLRMAAQEVYKECPGFQPFDGVPLGLRVHVFRSIPKSFSKKKHEDAIIGKVRPITKPDCTNYIKGIEDAVSGVLWKDDSLIVEDVCRKFFSDQPRIEMVVWPLVYNAGDSIATKL